MIPTFLDPGEDRGRGIEGCAAHRAAEGFGREGCPGRAQGGPREGPGRNGAVFTAGFTPENIDETWGNHRGFTMFYYGLNMVHYGLLWFTMVYP